VQLPALLPAAAEQLVFVAHGHCRAAWCATCVPVVLRVAWRLDLPAKKLPPHFARVTRNSCWLKLEGSTLIRAAPKQDVQEFWQHSHHKSSGATEQRDLINGKRTVLGTITPAGSESDGVGQIGLRE
jgi:hypothetical protein